MTNHDRILAKGFQHVGVPVRNMERSLSFYRDLFGIEPTFVADSNGPDVEQLVGVPGADILFAFLPIGNAVLELLEYRNPRGRDHDRRNCDIGAVHICFDVDDIEAVYELLLQRNVDVSGPPMPIESGPLAGYSSLYFKDPDGVQLEAMHFRPGPVQDER
jgi:catechol 2,3-dioxygenase-like lactoylglutathione lyase family enzyme